MTDLEAQDHVNGIYRALKVAEARYPGSTSIAVLHALLADAMEAFIAERPNVKRPSTDDGTDKPPSQP
ncbi:MAG: hypothetical protein LUO93_05805 [Methanomicrobiales archaeon]|nr:hypothetical protein [Methanomicrobiales archaeon]